MRRLPAISLDPMKFVQAFAAGLRAEFADAACAPLPEYLAALIRELDADQMRQLLFLVTANRRPILTLLKLA
jgi:hypothetical protein